MRPALLTVVLLCAVACEEKTHPAQSPPPVEAKEDPPGLPPPDDVKAPPAEAQTTASGLASKVLQPGTGTEHPAAEDTVVVNYTGWTPNGKMFDSSVVRGQPATFPLSGVIKGWTEGVQLMVQGEKRRFWIPGKLAYGDTPSRPGVPVGMLVFDIELLSLRKPTKPPAAPEDLAAAPKDAKRPKRGTAYRVLTAGSGKVHPGDAATVEIHYSAWNSEGTLVDSSIVRRKPATIPLQAQPGSWTENVKGMVVGEKSRFWIPDSQAYAEGAAKPAGASGLLVFDIELLAIQ